MKLNLENIVNTLKAVGEYLFPLRKITSKFTSIKSKKDLENFIKERAEAFKERRDFVVSSLNNIKGINCLTPNGAFYVFPSCKGLLNKKTKLKTDTEFVQKLLEKS